MPKKIFRSFVVLHLITFSFSQDCIEGSEVALWGTCYDIATTTTLNLFNTGLTGEIPSEIGNLTNLTSLILNSNELTGLIPIEIGNLLSLNLLRLQDNQFSGEIPSELGDLPNLDTLDLRFNQLSGLIPDSICNINLYLLDYNQLCLPYPDCIALFIGDQDTSSCNELSNTDIYPFEYSLNKPYPNPFNPTTTISFSISYFDKVLINVYDLNGNLITELVNSFYQPGEYIVNWNGDSYASGSYIIKMNAGSYENRQLVTLIK